MTGTHTEKREKQPVGLVPMDIERERNGTGACISKQRWMPVLPGPISKKMDLFKEFLDTKHRRSIDKHYRISVSDKDFFLLAILASRLQLPLAKLIWHWPVKNTYKSQILSNTEF